MSTRTKENKTIRKMMREVVNKRMDELYALPFKRRLRWAWRVVKGKKN